jgi:hypothetical protein
MFLKKIYLYFKINKKLKHIINNRLIYNDSLI